MRAVVAAGLCWAALSGLAVAAARPNVLVILTDEHNFRTLGCYRTLLPQQQAFIWGEGVAVETPHIDSIAKRGVLCDRFYAASPVCTPSRAAFFTGRYPQNAGAFQNDLPLNDDVVTFAEVLRRNGYVTGYAGKWHLDGPGKPEWGPKRAFGFDDNRYMFNRGHWKQLEDTPSGPAVKALNAAGQPSYDVKGADARSFTTDFLADKAVSFIQEHAGQPFCYVLSIPDPHGPNTVRPPYDTMYNHFTFQRPKTATETGFRLPACAAPPPKPQQENMSRYFGMVKCIDDNVGKVLAALQQAGVADRTIVIFTADHGDMCGEHGRVNKGIPLEGSARIPFVMAYPGLVKPGTVVHEALNNADFKPTLLGLLGMPQDASDQGRDASALLLAGKPPAGWKDVTFSRNSDGLWLMAASSRHKLILSVNGDPCLFDLAEDPFEMRNVCFDSSQRQTVRELALALQGYVQRTRETYAEQPGIRADLAWAVSDKAEYVAPKREMPAKKGRASKRQKDEDND